VLLWKTPIIQDILDLYSSLIVSWVLTRYPWIPSKHFWNCQYFEQVSIFGRKCYAGSNYHNLLFNFRAQQPNLMFQIMPWQRAVLVETPLRATHYNWISLKTLLLKWSSQQNRPNLMQMTTIFRTFHWHITWPRTCFLMLVMVCIEILILCDWFCQWNSG
jgi:hypothetical protein